MSPRPINMITFLRSKGWKIDHTSEKYYFLKPPSKFNFQEGTLFKIPASSRGSDTREYLVKMTYSIAELYDLDKFELLDLFSKSMEELKVDIQEQQRQVSLKQKFLKYARSHAS